MRNCRSERLERGKATPSLTRLVRLF